MLVLICEVLIIDYCNIVLQYGHTGIVFWHIAIHECKHAQLTRENEPTREYPAVQYSVLNTVYCMHRTIASPGINIAIHMYVLIHVYSRALLPRKIAIK